MGLSLRDGLRAGFGRLYAGPVRRAGERLGIDPQVRAGYERLADAAEAIDYRLAPDPYPVTVGDASARFHLSNRTEYNRASTLVGEREVLEGFLGRLRPDDVLWDVGGNIGTHTCLAADVLTEGRVVSFEPHPGNFADLEANVALNDLENVGRRQAALGEEAGSATLTLGGEGPGYGTHSLVSGDGVGEIEVAVEVGDDLIAGGLPSPTALKVDVQGAELAVLRGLEGALADTVRLALIEVHPPHAEVEAVEALFTERGFETTAFAERASGVFRNSVQFVRATRADGG